MNIIYEFSAHCWICSKQLSHRRMPSPVCTASLSNILHSGQIRAAFRGSTVLASNPGMINWRFEQQKVKEMLSADQKLATAGYYYHTVSDHEQQRTVLKWSHSSG